MLLLLPRHLASKLSYPVFELYHKVELLLLSKYTHGIGTLVQIYSLSVFRWAFLPNTLLLASAEHILVLLLLMASIL